jgi:hypothetical protein
MVMKRNQKLQDSKVTTKLPEELPRKGTKKHKKKNQLFFNCSGALTFV